MWKPGGHFLTQINYTAEYDQLMNQGLVNWLDTQNREPLELIKEKLLKINFIEDKNSGELRRPHHIDKKTGEYKGRKVIDPN